MRVRRRRAGRAGRGRRPRRRCRRRSPVTPTAGEEEKSVAAARQVPRALGGGDDGLRQRMLAVGLRGGGQRQQAVRRHLRPAETDFDGGDGGLALGQGAGLVEQHGVTVRIDSSASRSLTSTPPRAARSVAMETTSGIARPRACGQAITSTVMVRTTASSGDPASVQTTAVIAAGAEREPEQPARRRCRRSAGRGRRSSARRRRAG